MSLPKVDLRDVNDASTDYLYWKAVTYALADLRRSERNALLKEQQEKIDQEKAKKELEDKQAREQAEKFDKEQEKKFKEAEEKRKVSIEKNKLSGNVQPQIEYDPHVAYRFKLHQPEIHIIYDLLNEHISNFTKKTSYGAMCVRLRKKLKKRMIGETYSTELFDRRIVGGANVPINSIPKPELIGDRVFTVAGHSSLEGYKLERRNRRISDAKRKRQREKEQNEHDAYMLKLEAERSSVKKSDLPEADIEVEP
jgi:hypothetical protein